MVTLSPSRPCCPESVVSLHLILASNQQILLVLQADVQVLSGSIGRAPSGLSAGRDRPTLRPAAEKDDSCSSDYPGSLDASGEYPLVGG